MYNNYASKIIFTSFYSNRIGRSKLPDSIKLLPKKRDLTGKHLIVDYIQKYLTRFIEKDEPLFNALKVFIPNFFFNIPLEAIRKKQFTEIELKNILLTIAFFDDEAKVILADFVPNLFNNSNRIFISSRTANNCHGSVQKKIKGLKRELVISGKVELYSPWEALHQQVCSLGFYQFMKVRLRELMKADFYIELEKTDESSIEKIFVDLLNIKKIEF